MSRGDGKDRGPAGPWGRRQGQQCGQQWNPESPAQMGVWDNCPEVISTLLNFAFPIIPREQCSEHTEKLSASSDDFSPNHMRKRITTHSWLKTFIVKGFHWFKSVGQYLRRENKKGLISKEPSKILNKSLNILKFCIKYYSMIMVLHTLICMQTVWNVNPVHAGILHLPFFETLPILCLLKPHGLLHLLLTFCPWPPYNFCFPCWNFFWDQTVNALQHGHLYNQLYC